MIRRMAKQSWKFHETLGTYKNFGIFDNYSEALLIYNDIRDKDITNAKTRDGNYSKLFFYAFLRLKIKICK